MKTHIIIRGKRHVGKSTLVRRLLEGDDRPVYGFKTSSGKSLRQGFRSFFIYPASSETVPQSEENHIGDGNGVNRFSYPDAFDNYGVKCLEARPDGIIIMDELGFMEQDADVFCSKVLDLFDGDIPILATAKSGHDIPLLNKLFDHPNAEVYDITPENRDELYEKLKDRFR